MTNWEKHNVALAGQRPNEIDAAGQAALQRARPGISCFLSGGNPNSADLGQVIPSYLPTCLPSYFLRQSALQTLPSPEFR